MKQPISSIAANALYVLKNQQLTKNTINMKWINNQNG